MDNLVAPEKYRLRKTKTKNIRKTAICISCFTRCYTQLCSALRQTQSHSAALIDDKNNDITAVKD